MKKKNIIIWIVPLLTAIVIIFYIQSKKSTLPRDMQDFAVKDTASINKIFMADMAGLEATLTRENNIWKINKKFDVRPDVIKTLLKTIHDVEIKSPVGNKMKENVTKRLSSSSIKVEIYIKDELVKTFYIGGETQDKTGTIAILEDVDTKVKASDPYVLHIPGFIGYLTPRFFVEERKWRDRTIFNYKPSDIKEIDIVWNENKSNSFKYVNDKNGKQILDLTGKILNNIDTLKINKYIGIFNKVIFDYVVGEMDKHNRDSVLASNPAFTINVYDFSGTKTKLDLFYKIPDKESYDINGKLITKDLDLMYAIINNNKQDLYVIQLYLFDKILRPINYFVKI